MREAEDVWIREEDAPRAAPRAKGRAPGRGARSARSPARRPSVPAAPPPPEAELHVPVDDLVDRLGPSKGRKAAEQLKEAARALERDQLAEARRLLSMLSRDVPDLAAVRELHGIVLYRLGRWRDARRELLAFVDLTGSTEQHPVLADCQRALKQWTAVEELWDELREASPDPALVAEGRIVMAGALADQGRLRDAVALLARASRPVKRVQPHHLRTAYALADLKERAGDLPGARELFTWVDGQVPGFADVSQRLRALD